MCGIAGYVGGFDQNLLDRMSERIAHRGPDDSGSIVLQGSNPAVGLAHRRLSIIDLSEDGRQPMTVDCPECVCTHDLKDADKIWLTYNGELYNYQELRANLERDGHRFRSHSDTEVLLHLYGAYGERMLSRLNGIFAFAIYDGRRGRREGTIESGDLFLARDGFGVKPLYYSDIRDGFLFASELKSILAADGAPSELDPLAIHHYLAYLWAPAPQTPIKNICKLHPGEALVVRHGHIFRNWFFYDLPYGQSRATENETEVARLLDHQLETAVRRQLVADVEIGAFLSGGLDSSAVVAMMRRIDPDRRPLCYSIGFAGQDDMDGDAPDLPYARKVAEHLDVRWRPIEITPDTINHMAQVLYHLDEPQADPSPINVYLISREARLDGIKVLLSGIGGDDIFSGYRRHLALTLEGLWSWLPERFRKVMAEQASDGTGARHRTRWGKHPMLRRLQKVLVHMGLPEEDRLPAYFLWGQEALRQTLYSGDFQNELAGTDTLAPLKKSLKRIPSESEPLNRMLYLEAKHFLTDHNLNYTDKASMAVGVETRVPLLDPDLVALATRIPARMKQKGRTGKSIFKIAMEKSLPRDVIYRPKIGFGAPMRRWVRNELREMVDETLSVQSLKNRGLFDPAAVHRLVRADREGWIDGAYTIFSLVCIELWLRMFLDRKGTMDGL
ncbi:Asparagine synthetase [glutamine-hydrolyzing] (EC [Olavius algarvensis associated proteobacterium Delta 3]|nr:Asparagine synthetase [glutamine-hydrolyzing] (EC [Olavius algarvensis associated proteobacterium Delta 3]CAB5113683.1 Asparagine synthetase [glutamine-hydrolyzing] (EC [Olavius algarvensis associated proteobacterium Delta 3]